MPVKTANKNGNAAPILGAGTVPPTDTAPKEEAAQITIDRIGKKEAQIKVVGTAPLIVHRFSEKAKQQMLDKQQGKTRVKKAPKDPQADYEGAFYRLPETEPGVPRYGFPATGFKAATIGAARYFDGVPMTILRRAMFFFGEGTDQLIEIHGEPHMREDVVRISAGSTDLRYRPQFDEWTATLNIIYVPSMLTLESLVALVDAGGMSGVGEWRPGKSDSGAYGTYEVSANDAFILG
jgi:hypothetical protein